MVCKSSDDRKCTLHEVEQDTTAGKQTDTVNINSFNFDSIQSTIVANLKLAAVKITQ